MINQLPADVEAWRNYLAEKMESEGFTPALPTLPGGRWSFPNDPAAQRDFLERIKAYELSLFTWRHRVVEHWVGVLSFLDPKQVLDGLVAIGELNEWTLDPRENVLERVGPVNQVLDQIASEVV